MKKFDYLFTSIIIYAIIVSTASLGMSIESNEKFQNINENFQSIIESNFKLQMNTMVKDCIQDFEIEINFGAEYIDALNQRTRCLTQIDVAEKIFAYQQYGIDPNFTDKEMEFVERVANQNSFPLLEELRATTTNSTK